MKKPHKFDPKYHELSGRTQRMTSKRINSVLGQISTRAKRDKLSKEQHDAIRKAILTHPEIEPSVEEIERIYAHHSKKP